MKKLMVISETDVNKMVGLLHHLDPDQFKGDMHDLIIRAKLAREALKAGDTVDLHIGPDAPTEGYDEKI